MLDKILRWLTYKLLYYRLVNTHNCMGARYKDESGKRKVMFDVKIV